MAAAGVSRADLYSSRVEEEAAAVSSTSCVSPGAAGVARDPDVSGPAISSEPRLRAGGVVLRRGPLLGTIEVLLITRRNAPTSFTVPAGKFENDIDGGSFEVCAVRETKEEAGVDCKVLHDLDWFYGQAKDLTETRTRFYVMQHLRQQTNWVEGSSRERRWVDLKEASQLVDRRKKPMLVDLFQRVDIALQEQATSGRPWNLHRGDADGDQDAASDTGKRSPTSHRSTSDESDNMEELEHLPEHEDIDLRGVQDDATPPADRRLSSGSIRRSTSRTSHDYHIEDMDGERFRFYGNQVGGHFCLVKPALESEVIVITPRSCKSLDAAKQTLPAQSLVLKPLFQQEYAFYKEITGHVPELQAYLPTLYGTKTLSHRQVSAMTAEAALARDEGVAKPSEQQSFWEERQRSHDFKTYMVLEDLAHRMKSPCILDLKMGCKQRSKQHSPKKRERHRLKSKSTTSHNLGFRICGLHSEGCFHDKYWGRSVSVETMREKLSAFFLDPRSRHVEEQRCLTRELLQRVRGLFETVSALKHWRFWSSSLLFLYDSESPLDTADMRMIDFTHCSYVSSPTPDMEYLCGLKNVEIYLMALADDHPYEPWIIANLAKPPYESIQNAEEVEDDGDAPAFTLSTPTNGDLR